VQSTNMRSRLPESFTIMFLLFKFGLHVGWIENDRVRL
jgi:hypothetical protein